MRASKNVLFIEFELLCQKLWAFREVSFSGGGLLKIGGDQVLCLKSKGGIKRFFQIKKGGSLIFFKEIKYFVKHSWNSC